MNKQNRRSPMQTRYYIISALFSTADSIRQGHNMFVGLLYRCTVSIAYDYSTVVGSKLFSILRHDEEMFLSLTVLLLHTLT